MESVLSIENVSKRIGSRQIVSRLNMSVQHGEVYGFLGPNGAGKTTTIRMIVGLARPTEGVIRVMGHDVQRDRAQALKHVGTIVENPETYSYLTGRQNLLHYARLAGIDRPKLRIEELAEQVGLADRLDEKVKRYSLGMRQRLGVAQALLDHPKLLVLDEPTNGLDPAGMREFRELMRQLAGFGMAVFVSSHLLSEVQMMCDRVAILKSGKIIAEQRVSDLVEGTTTGVVVQVGRAGEAVSPLAEHGFTAHRLDDHRVRVQISSEDVPRLVRSLVACDVDVYAIEPERDSLEDAFLQLTDETVQETATSIAGGGTDA